MSSLYWTVADGWTMTRRDLAHWARRPAPVVVGLLFPILLVLMFGYLLGGAIAVPGGGDYREFLLPGMFVMTMGFGVESTLLAVTTDASRGVTDRFRSMPMAPSAVVVGRCGADLLNSVLVLAVMVGCGLAVGWRPHGGVGATLGAFGLLLLLRFAFLWLGIYLGLVVADPGAVTLVQTVIWPVTFLSNVFVSPDSMPGWLGAIATWNPLSATAAATRELFGNPGAAAGWIGVAAVWPLLLVAVFGPLSVRAFRRLSR
ncbi:ABC transporter permease [Kutzneria buriramensis]|uniref:Transport permease protein n=1 Tax=Kutzneria buriramensis TaxID=1045776 RepID=A0A3E0HBK4_9PSEU|nr:ABC transporter permease [Kutzneria buriramensis]REH41792.1 ABC-type multidrug transport system permease subunit [Kutzneria buriramensis]